MKLNHTNIRLVITRLVIILLCLCSGNSKISQTILFNQNWKFLKTDNTTLSLKDVAGMNDTLWEDIMLPHTASIEPLVIKDQQWTGICWYKKAFNTDPGNKGKHISILFEAAMHDVTVWLNGIEIRRHYGGYLPFYLDISDLIHFDSENTLVIRLDNRENLSIPPGKPLKELDFNYYRGIYRNAGFNQTEFKDLKPADRTSRQLRGYGEVRLLQQALNFMEAYNSNLSGPAIGSSNWGMFDYNRGYASDIETSGIMDIIRIPKFTFWFYKSQSDNEPVCFIASFNTLASAKYIRVFSNGDSVALYRNGILLSTQKPDVSQNTANLPHPPFTFEMSSFEAGNLRAESFKHGTLWAEHTISTEGKESKLKMEADLCGLKLKPGDIIFINASVTDVNGNVPYDSTLPVSFTMEGDAKIIGNNPFSSEAGIATVLIKAGNTSGKIVISAESTNLIPARLEILNGN